MRRIFSVFSRNIRYVRVIRVPRTFDGQFQAKRAGCTECELTTGIKSSTKGEMR